ncbi:unnamed protein product, partial [Rotaria sordida]
CRLSSIYSNSINSDVNCLKVIGSDNGISFLLTTVNSYLSFEI